MFILIIKEVMHYDGSKCCPSPDMLWQVIHQLTAHHWECWQGIEDEDVQDTGLLLDDEGDFEVFEAETAAHSKWEKMARK